MKGEGEEEGEEEELRKEEEKKKKRRSISTKYAGTYLVQTSKFNTVA